MEILVNLVISLLIVGMTYALASEGLWGAALMFFDVLFAGLIAFNFYEPLAKVIADNVPFIAGFADSVCMLGLFTLATFLLRLATDSLAPTMVRFPTPLFHLGRWFFGLACSVLTVAIILLAFDASPIHKKVFGVIDYKTEVPFGLGIEREWLAFFQYSTGQVFVTHAPGTRDPFEQYGDAKVFDPRAEWLLLHEEARPIGEGSILNDAAGGAAPAGAPAPAPGAGAQGGNANPGDPVVVGPAVGGGVVLPQ